MTDGSSAYCRGCPRRGPFLAMAKLGLVVRGDVVCHVNGTLPPGPVLHTCRDLPEGVGANEPRGEGQARATGKDGGSPGKHRRSEFRGREIRVISDRDFLHPDFASTLHASSSGGCMLMVVFSNGTAEVEGGISDRCRALGLDQVTVADPYSVEDTSAVLREGLRLEAASVVVAEAPCALRYGLHNPVYVVDPDLCTGCKHCLKVGCDALKVLVDDDEVRKAEVSAADCVGCGLCQQLCREGAISPSGRMPGQR